MGQHLSGLRQSFQAFQAWDLGRVRDVIMAFRESGMGFALGYNDVAYLFRGDTAVAKLVLSTFGATSSGTGHLAEVVDALTLLASLVLLARATPTDQPTPQLDPMDTYPPTTTTPTHYSSTAAGGGGSGGNGGCESHSPTSSPSRSSRDSPNKNRRRRRLHKPQDRGNTYDQVALFFDVFSVCSSGDALTCGELELMAEAAFRGLCVMSTGQHCDVEGKEGSAAAIAQRVVDYLFQSQTRSKAWGMPRGTATAFVQARLFALGQRSDLGAPSSVQDVVAMFTSPPGGPGCGAASAGPRPGSGRVYEGTGLFPSSPCAPAPGTPATAFTGGPVDHHQAVATLRSCASSSSTEPLAREFVREGPNEALVNPFFVRDSAVLRIQNCWRCRKSRVLVGALLRYWRAAIFVQSRVRRKLCAQAVSRKVRAHASAIAIQKCVRRRAAWAWCQRKLQERSAATRIQRRARSWRARRDVMQRKEGIAEEATKRAVSLYRLQVRAHDALALGPEAAGHSDSGAARASSAKCAGGDAPSAGAKLNEAERHARVALQMREELDTSRVGRLTVQTAVAIHNLAAILDHEGRFEEAEALYRRAVSIKQFELGSDDPQTATTTSNLALVMANQGKTEQAERLFRQALEVKEKHLGLSHLDLAPVLTGLGSTLDKLSQSQEAVSCYRRALAIRREHLGKWDPSTAATLQGLASALLVNGEQAEAKTCLEELLRLQTQTPTLASPSASTQKEPFKDDVGTLRTLSTLALISYNQGDHTAAADLYRRAYVAKVRIRGERDVDTAATANNLAGVYSAMKDYERAQHFYTLALQVRADKLGPTSFHTASTTSNLAIVMFQLGDSRSALAHMERALRVKEKILGSDHESTRNSANWVRHLKAVELSKPSQDPAGDGDGDGGGGGHAYRQYDPDIEADAETVDGSDLDGDLESVSMLPPS